MMTALKLLVKMIAVCFALVLAWAIMEDIPRWGLNLMVLALLIVALSLWVKCEAWSKRYLLKAALKNGQMSDSKSSRSFYTTAARKIAPRRPIVGRQPEKAEQ